MVLSAGALAWQLISLFPSAVASGVGCGGGGLMVCVCVCGGGFEVCLGGRESGGVCRSWPRECEGLTFGDAMSGSCNSIMGWK